MTERLSNKCPCDECGKDKRCELSQEACENFIKWEDDCIKKLAEYETAEEEGRLVILPKCNIGDTVYLPIDFQDKIYIGEIEGFEYAKMRNKWVVKIRTDDEGICYEAFDDFGKTFFLDVEDAEKMLRR
ncbi:hypothetical protein H9X90_05530 [Faecalicatena contorta]|uniref:hypothetical protein n=1 Tax=Faecalicatena contorta TaxID=39482 RepID=UPI001961834C|nr:hypothetical protein [Faecalicatena contorta]MBM6685462.1 hypothetical protein [Faecalicatena contorta]MBM6710204.1 hypothetical protein [Faecalicatena contorta]